MVAGVVMMVYILHDAAETKEGNRDGDGEGFYRTKERLYGRERDIRSKQGFLLLFV